MTSYKIKDFPLGKPFRVYSMSDKKTARFEEELFEKIKSELPADVVLVSVDVQVRYHAACEPGKAGFDVEMFRYAVGVPVEKEIPLSTRGVPFQQDKEHE